MSTDNLSYTFTVAAKDGQNYFTAEDDLTRDRFAKHEQPLHIISPGMEDPDFYALIKRDDKIIDTGKTIWVHGDSAFYRGLKGIYDRYKKEQPSSTLHSQLEAEYFEVGDTVELTMVNPENFQQFAAEPALART